MPSGRFRTKADGTFAQTVFTTSAPIEALQSQRAYVASTGRVTLTAAGNFRVYFENPASSARNIVVTSLAAIDSGPLGWADLIINPTTGIPAEIAANVLTPLNAVILAADNAPASLAIMRRDTDLTVPLGGGRVALQLGIPGGGARTVFGQGGFVITPGSKLGINVAFAGAADAAMSVYYYEEPL